MSSVPCDSRCAGAGAADLEVVNLAEAGLLDGKAPALAEQLGKFPALKRLDLSANPRLELGSLSLIFKALSGKTRLPAPPPPRLLSHMCFLAFDSFPFFLLRRSHCSPGAHQFTELNLGGTGADSLPDDIAQHMPNLAKLVLDHCVKLSCLPVLLGSLKHLDHVSVKGCTALVHPPISQRADPSQTALFLRQLHDNSEIWRQIKVQKPPSLA
jgi:hypothetical protein